VEFKEGKEGTEGFNKQISIRKGANTHDAEKFCAVIRKDMKGGN